MTRGTAACQDFLFFTISLSWLKLMSIELVMPSNHLILCGPLLLLPSVFPSIRVFSNESGLHSRWPKYWSFSVSPSNKYSGLISFRIDCFDFLAVQGTLKSLLQRHTWKASIVQHSAFLKFPWSRKWGNTHSSILVFRIPWREEPGLLQSKGLQRIGHD